jgi:hypothetical protein
MIGMRGVRFACGPQEIPIVKKQLGLVLLVCAAAGSFLAQSIAAAGLRSGAVQAPGGEAGIGFDDIGFAQSLGKVLAPAGRTGKLDLIDPLTKSVETINGFSALPPASAGHGAGITSADMGGGLIFATDRTAMRLDVVDPKQKQIIGYAGLSASPDYVRAVVPTSEVWVTEPDKERIEIFTLPLPRVATPTLREIVSVPGGPESLVVDAARGVAYANLWKGETVALNLASHKVVSRWKNDCVGSRGLALDAARGFLFVGCAEGVATTLDLNKNGLVVSKLKAGDGIDIIAFNQKLSHLYLPGGKSATMAIANVSPRGELSLLDTIPTARHAHCVAADDRDGIWVCDPEHGRLLWFTDAAH